MNILYSLPFWPYLYTPWLFRSMQWMQARGHKLAVLSMGDLPGQKADLKAFELQDVPVLQVRTQHRSDVQLLRDVISMPPAGWLARPAQSLGAFRRASGVRQGLHQWLVNKRVIAFVRRHKIEVVEAHWASHSATMALQIQASTGIPYSVRLWGGDMYRNPSPDLPAIIASASAICPASRFLADLLMAKRPVESLPLVPAMNLDPTKLRICHHGLPEEAIATEPAPQSNDACVVGTIGRLDPEKRQAHLVQAIARLAPTYPGLRLRIVGGGQLEPSLRALAKELGIADRVHITGSVPWVQVIEERKKFHIYAHAAAVEGFSLATLEGISQGLPSVATRTGAHAQMIVEGVTGYLTAIEDVDGITAAIRRLLEAGPAGRASMAKAAIDYVRRHFLYSKVMAYSESILDAVSKDAPLPA